MFPSHCVAFIRLGGKSSPIKVMGNDGRRQPNPPSFTFYRFQPRKMERKKDQREREKEGGRERKRENQRGANDYHYQLVYLS